MSVSFVRFIAPFVVLAGLPSGASAGLPACESELGVVLPSVGGTGCAVELFVRPDPDHEPWLKLTHTPLPSEVQEYAFHLVLDRRGLVMPNPNDWFRVLVVETQLASNPSRRWAIDVNRRSKTGTNLRLVEIGFEPGSASTVVSSISLETPLPCTRVEGVWRREGVEQSSLAWHVSTPANCNSPDDNQGPVRSIVHRNVGELRSAVIGSIAVFGSGPADGSVVANLIAY